MSHRLMAYNPGVSFFIPFRELDPSRTAQCMFFTQKGKRCRYTCQESDNRRAIALHETINTISNEAVRLDILQEYVLCNCCRSGRAQHRDRIEDVGLLTPLARRWQDEIRRHTKFTTSIPALEGSIHTTDTCTTLPTSSLNDTTALNKSTEDSFYYQLNDRTSSSINATDHVANVLCSQYNSLRTSTLVNSGLRSLENQSRYELRRCKTSLNSTPALLAFVYQPPQSEFRPHILDPKPCDSVSCKILNRLKGRDFKIGSLYIFERTSSYGHVKIGWTASSVSCRLQDWSKCGYVPYLLFSVNDIPHAQRVETLTHYELIKEWRRERMCKASWCRKSHQEWFEINKERAEQVLGNWAEFMKRAEPYDLEGRLKSQWRTAVETIGRDGGVVTAEKLLERYEESLVEVGFENGLKLERLETLEKTSVRTASLLNEEPTLPNETTLLKNAALSRQSLLTETSLSKPEIESKSEPVQNEVLASQTTAVKQEILHQQDPLFPSPTLQANLLDVAVIPSEHRTSRSLERAAFKIINELCNESSQGAPILDMKVLGGRKTLKCEALPAVEATAGA